MNTRARKVIKIGIYLLLCGIIVVFLLFVGMQFFLAKIDDNANRAFDEKARQLEIEGKSKAYVIRHFGEPDYIVRDGPYETFVYIPGPSLLIWNGECRIGVDNRTGTVKGWVVNQ